MNERILNAYLTLTSDNTALLNFAQNPQEYFQSVSITDAAEQNLITTMIEPYYKLQTMINEPLNRVNNTYREGLMASVNQTIAGYKKTMTMYQVSFYLGVLLIVAALLFAVFTKSSLFSILFGSIGAIDLRVEHQGAYTEAAFPRNGFCAAQPEPVVSGVLQKEAADVIAARCREVGAPLVAGTSAGSASGSSSKSAAV